MPVSKKRIDIGINHGIAGEQGGFDFPVSVGFKEGTNGAQQLAALLQRFYGCGGQIVGVGVIHWSEAE